MTISTNDPPTQEDDAPDRTQRRRARLQQAFEMHHVALLHLASTLGSRELADAEDAVHDTYLVLFTQRGELLDDHAPPAEVERRLRTYLYGSVRGRMMNIARGHATRARGNARLDPAPVSAPLQPPDHRLEDDELHTTYETALKQLSSQQEAVIRHLFEDGWTYAEIADHLQISTGAAKQHAARAMKKAAQMVRDMTALLPRRRRQQNNCPVYQIACWWYSGVSRTAKI